MKCFLCMLYPPQVFPPDWDPEPVTIYRGALLCAGHASSVSQNPQLLDRPFGR